MHSQAMLDALDKAKGDDGKFSETTALLFVKFIGWWLQNIEGILGISMDKHTAKWF